MLPLAPARCLDPRQHTPIQPLEERRRDGRAARPTDLQIAEHTAGPVGAVGLFCKAIGLQDIADLPARPDDVGHAIVQNAHNNQHCNFDKEAELTDTAACDAAQPCGNHHADEEGSGIATSKVSSRRSGGLAARIEDCLSSLD
jgi:hypothetical protein